jgi:hypothetical protein
MSLTKKTLLSELACSKAEKLPVKLFGHEVWVKPVSEFQRSRRIAKLYGKGGQISEEVMANARLFTIIDHLCNKDGEPFFNEQDVDELSQLDSLAIDVLVNAIEEWSSKRAGKVQGRSKG